MSHTLNKVSNRERRNFAAKIKEIVLYTPELRIAKKKKERKKTHLICDNKENVWQGVTRISNTFVI